MKIIITALTTNERIDERELVIITTQLKTSKQ